VGTDSFSALREYLQFRPKAIKQILAEPRTAKEVRSLLEQVNCKHILPKLIVREDETQPLWVSLDIQPKPESVATQDWEARKSDVIVALDQITDPRNLGAIVRSCGFFGVREILFQEKRQVGITRAAVATAQGGFALVDAVVVTNLGRALTQLKDLGYWICGATMNGEPAETIAGFYEKSVLVLGSEERGLSSGILEKCDRLVGIPGAKPGVESLNVSVAAGILLDAWWRKGQKTDC
jgi:predicted rRNA methylase